MIIANHLIIGHGNVGKALYNVLKKTDKGIKIVDKNPRDLKFVDVIHICFPYGESFETLVEEYIQKYDPKIAVIHSTVRVGTTSHIREHSGIEVLHSPVLGQHNALEEGLLTFDKWIAPANKEIKKYFKKAGMTVVCKEKSETTELAKLFSTFRYGLAIARAQEEKRICDQIDVDFEDVSIKFLEMYNEGYSLIDMYDIRQPVTTPGFIGGHCVMPNIDLLLSTYPNFIFGKAIKQSNNLKENE
jgi:3-hydroxyisobutyrate dehydrogenase-like beta-hydroxyacid dehydrogenase